MRSLDRSAALALALLACAASITARAGDVKSGPAGPPEAKLAKAVGRPWLTDLAAGRTEAIARDGRFLCDWAPSGARGAGSSRPSSPRPRLRKCSKAGRSSRSMSIRTPATPQALGVVSIPALRLLSPPARSWPRATDSSPQTIWSRGWKRIRQKPANRRR